MSDNTAIVLIAAISALFMGCLWHSCDQVAIECVRSHQQWINNQCVKP